ncbi:MAG: hypothetical protein HY363_03400 [Candidatus Aenigmarchaeota archaeon]|nr:hypothetical protein [Candidatus Aenigmarchaeota archaeon]
MNKQIYAATLLAVCLAFVFGVIVGGSYRGRQIDEVSQFIKNGELTTESYVLEQELLEGLDTNCNLAKARLNTLSNDLYQLGKLLSGETARQDLGETQYRFLKRKFHLMQIQTYVLYLKLRKNCNVESHVVLFYFSRQNENSTLQGRILDSLVQEYDLRVFAVEYNYSSELNFIEDYYNVTVTPAIVLDYEKKFEGLVDESVLAAQLS